MKLITTSFLCLIVLTFSCTEQEDILPQNDLSEDPIDNTGSSYEIKFSVENENGFETETSINFLNESINLIEYRWDFGDGTISNDQNPDHVFSKPGKYNVTLNGVNSSGNELSVSQEIFVRPLNSQLDVLFISYLDNSLNYVNLSSNTVTKLYDVPYNPAGVLALDESNGKVYYYDYDSNTIIENGIGINDPKPLFTDLAGVSDIEFDQVTKTLYIALSYDDIIISYNTFTQNFTSTFGSSNEGKFGKIRDMELKNGKLFTITPTQSYESIFEINLAEEDVNQLIDYQSAGYGYGYGVAYDDLNDKLYFNNVEQTALMRSDADGSNIEKVIDLDRYGTVSFAELCLVGLKVVETRNLIMWSAWDDNKLYLLDLEASQESVLEINGLVGKFVPFENTGLVLN